MAYNFTYTGFYKVGYTDNLSPFTPSPSIFPSSHQSSLNCKPLRDALYLSALSTCQSACQYSVNRCRSLVFSVCRNLPHISDEWVTGFGSPCLSVSFLGSCWGGGLFKAGVLWIICCYLDRCLRNAPGLFQSPPPPQCLSLSSPLLVSLFSCLESSSDRLTSLLWLSFPLSSILTHSTVTDRLEGSP